VPPERTTPKPAGSAHKQASHKQAANKQTSGNRATSKSKPAEVPEPPGSAPEVATSRVAREPERRKLTEPSVMRALAHPLRLALMEALGREGPLTATAAAELLDDSPGNMSWHLNVLAKHGFVEEAEGGRGRARPWRLVNLGTEFIDSPDNPELSLAGETFTRVLLDRNNKRAHQWLDEKRSYPARWRKAAFTTNAVTYLTAEELEEVGDKITDLLNEYRGRSLDIDKRPKGSRPVSIGAIGYPLPPLPSGN
jgi:DNA-binding transcriptional ArsR family regulator